MEKCSQKSFKSKTSMVLADMLGATNEIYLLCPKKCVLGRTKKKFTVSACISPYRTNMYGYTHKY